MTALLLDGKNLAALRRNELKQSIKQLLHEGNRAPGLAVVLVGNDPASTIYVNNKRKACEEVGIISHFYDLPAETSEKDLLLLIDKLNQAEDIDGILVQLPLPPQIDTSLIIEHIKPEKDVDGFHPYNLGRLAQKKPLLRPCTPMGIMDLLKHYKLDVKGKHALVIGASNIVGRPMGLELLLSGATVTISHRFTHSLQKFVEIANVIIVATGIKDLVDTEWLNEKQILIDVGMHRLADGSLRGDVDFKKAVDKVAWITPVPGGVGPMTIISLLENTLTAQINNKV